MGYRIALNRFEGEDLENAAEKLAKIFRMDKDEASRIVVGLSDGNAWQFQHEISTKQSEMAESFLTSLGFEVDRHPVIHEAHHDEDAHEEKTEKKGLLGKIWLELNKKR